MKNIILTAICVTIIAFTSCKGQNNKVAETIEPKVFAEKIHNADVTLLDVRTPEEYASQHIDNATNINFNDDSFESKVNKLDKNKPVYIYCLAGSRSAKAMDKLSDLGFKEVYNLQGGIMKWNAEGLSKPKAIEGMTLVEFQKLVKSDKKVLIDFYAEWCGPCKKMAPYIEKMKTEMKGQIKIVKIDTDKNQKLAQDLGIEGLPTLILYKEGKESWRNLGFIPEEELKKRL